MIDSPQFRHVPLAREVAHAPGASHYSPCINQHPRCVYCIHTATVCPDNVLPADLFESFVGGLYLDRGLEITKTWLHPLLRPYIAEAYRIVRVQHGLPPDPDPPYPTIALAFSQAQNNSPLANGAENPRPTPPTWSIPPPPRIPGNVGHLSLFNQYLQQQCKNIEWVYSDSAGEGTKTTPIWVVRAMVDGECLGRGRGSTKKAARNEAAKEGLLALGVYVS